METVRLFIGTVALRPYVFVFLAVYLIAIVRMFGWQRTILFTGICWVIAFLSEYSSTRNGFPYGLYHYIETTRGKELWVSNVPFMDSLSYTFLQFAGFNVALFTFFNRRGTHICIPETFKRPWLFAAITGVFVTYMDIIIDPVAHQGDKWFLGQIYYYPEPGHYFDVPASNFLGWWLVSFVSIFLYLKLERFLPPRNRDKRGYKIPFSDAFGVLVYLGVIVFNLGVTAMIGDFHLLYAGIYIYFLPILLWIFLLLRTNEQKN